MARRQPRTYDVSTRAGALKVHCWEPDAGITAPLTVVTVHPWAVLGGSEYNCVGICQVLRNEASAPSRSTFAPRLWYGASSQITPPRCARYTTSASGLRRHSRQLASFCLALLQVPPGRLCPRPHRISCGAPSAWGTHSGGLPRLASGGIWRTPPPEKPRLMIMATGTSSHRRRLTKAGRQGARGHHL